MNYFNYLKISGSKKIRFLKLNQKNTTYLVFLHGFKSDLEGKNLKLFLTSQKKINLAFSP